MSTVPVESAYPDPVSETPRPEWWRGVLPANGVSTLNELSAYVAERLDLLQSLEGYPAPHPEIGVGIAAEARANAERMLERLEIPLPPSQGDNLETTLRSLLAVIRTAGAKPDTNPPPAPSLEKFDAKILDILESRCGIAATVEDLEVVADGKTVTKRLKYLQKIGYADRPEGAKIKWVITPAGSSRLKLLPAI